jgi:hypothetical protein
LALKLEALAENRKLYERLLQAEQEKVALLEKMLEDKKVVSGIKIKASHGKP